MAFTAIEKKPIYADLPDCQTFFRYKLIYTNLIAVR